MAISQGRDSALAPARSTTQEQAAARPRVVTAGITPRAFLIGTALIPLMCYWVEYTEIVAQGTDLAAMSLIIGAVFALFLLICFNGLLSRVAPRWMFSQAELMFIYIMQTVSIGISGIGMMQFLVPTLGNAYKFATAGNEWETRFHPFIPAWLVPNRTDPLVLDKFYQGNANWTDYAGAWAGPIFWWTGFICVLLGSMLCLNVILRRQWMDQEKLPFPIVYLPLELTRSDPESGPIWRNRLFWIAFLIPVVLESLASINYLYPSVPAIPLKPSTLPNLGQFLTSPPWSAVGGLSLAFYPMVIGLIYFLPVDVSFSGWFFFLFARLQDVFATAMGWRGEGVPPTLARIPYHGEQGAGAFLGLALFGFWSYRKYLGAVIGKAFGEKEAADVHDENEPMPYRMAVFGFLIGFALLCFFAIQAGMAWWLPPIFLMIYFIFATTFTRARAEAGLPWGYGPFVSPHGLLTSVAGTKGYDPQTLTAFALFQWFTFDFRAMAMPHQMEAMKIAGSTDVRMNNRHLVWVILWATLIGALASWWALLAIYYEHGAATANVNSWRTSMGTTPWRNLEDWLRNPTPFDMNRVYGVFGGMGFVGFLMTMRTRLLSWPFHPIGYVLAETSTMGWLWFPTFLGWLIKLLVLRYGGIRAFRTGIPFFIGLILGDYVISCLWALFGLYLGIPTYRAFPI